jgi:carbon starvation protein CstA
LWLVTIYLKKEKKLYWISLIPALLMTAVCSTYVAYDPLFFNLSIGISSVIGWTMAFLAGSIFLIRTKK